MKGKKNCLTSSETLVAESVYFLSLDVEEGLSGEGRLDRHKAPPDFMAQPSSNFKWKHFFGMTFYVS